MNRYEFPLPRASLALAAAALSVLTFALAVVLPAQLASDRQEAAVLAVPHVVKLAPIEVAIRRAALDTASECGQEAVIDDDSLAERDDRVERGEVAERDGAVRLKTAQRGASPDRGTDSPRAYC